MKKHLLNKYIDGTASEMEAEIVLDWFGSEDGQTWLAERFDQDAKASARAMDEGSVLNHLNPDELQKGSQTDQLRIGSRQRPVSVRSSALRWVLIAAVLLASVLISLFQFFYLEKAMPEISEVFIEYSTTDEEHRVITLNDGTRVRLNENSSIRFPETWSTDYRMVDLQGEAFFEVAVDSLRPFVVEAGRAEVQVLGTAFNVKTETRSGEMVVAVSEGRVTLGSKSESAVNHQVLEKNMVGLLNLETNDVSTEHADVTNYVSWMHGRVIYNATPFEEVISQLGHIYDIRNEIQNEELYALNLTADFSERSLDNVLETIARSLGIEMEKEGHKVKWRKASNR